MNSHPWRRRIRFALIAASVAAGAVVWHSVFPRGFFIALRVAGLAMMALSALAMVLTFRAAKVVSPLALVISIVVSMATALVTIALTTGPPAGLAEMTALATGWLTGAGWALTTTVFAEADTVRSRGSGWYLAAWVATLMLTQLLPMIAGRTPSATIAVLLLGTGLVLGQSGTMLLRWWLARPAPSTVRG